MKNLSLAALVVSVLFMIVLVVRESVSAIDTSGMIVGVVEPAIELRWETDADYCGDPIDPYRDVCMDVVASVPVGTSSGIISVGSNSPNGYLVTLKMRNDDANLNRLVSQSVAEYISPVSSSTLTDNTWGFYAGTTPSYQAVPLASTSGANIVSYATTPNRGAAPGTDIIPVTFGVRVNFLLPTQTSYSNQVIFTAVANPI